MTHRFRQAEGGVQNPERSVSKRYEMLRSTFENSLFDMRKRCILLHGVAKRFTPKPTPTQLWLVALM